MQQCAYVDTTAEADTLGDADTVKNIELHVIARQGAFQLSRQFFFQFFGLPHRVQQEGAAFLDASQQVVVPVDMQVSLLRVLQEQSVTKLGSNTAKTLDVRAGRSSGGGGGAA